METRILTLPTEPDSESQEEKVIELGDVSCETKGGLIGGVQEGGFTWFVA